jgi:hypothetical protein
MSDGKPAEEFNVQAILEKIDRCLALGDGDGAIMEINRPWPGMDADLRLAVAELLAELERNGTAPLFMKDLQFDDRAETVGIQFPDWFVAADRAFARRYPDPREAGLRFQKTIAALHARLPPASGRRPLRLEDLAEALGEWLPAGGLAHPGARLH